MGEQRKLLNVPSNLNEVSTANLLENFIYPSSHQYHSLHYYKQDQQQQSPHMLTDSSNSYNYPINQKIMSCQCSSQAERRHQQEQRIVPSKCNDHQAGSSTNGQRVAVIVHHQASSSARNNEMNITSSTMCKNLDLGSKDVSLKANSQCGSPLVDCSYQARNLDKHLGEDIACYHNSNPDTDTKDNVNVSDQSSNFNSHEMNKRNSTINNKKNILSMSEAMLTADEITVSESDNNSATVQRRERSHKKLKSNSSKEGNYAIGLSNNTNVIRSSNRSSKCSNNTKNSSNYIDMYCSGENLNGSAERYLMEKKNSSQTSMDDLRPPLPPRPPPSPQQTLNVLSNGTVHNYDGPVFKKYMVWCLLCGIFSCVLGCIFLGVYFRMHTYTITGGNFETVPSFVPASLLILTGLCVMTLAKRRNRYNYLIKISGLCGLISALTCAMVTVTTIVLHMSRLQALRECEYAQKTRTCTCYSDYTAESSEVDRTEHGLRLVFDSLSDCGVVHGFLYSCLRVIFGLSVAGVLVAVFTCMLVYQLLSHERKKMYWEQLELRCRSLYTRQPISTANIESHGVLNGYHCCEQCHTHTSVSLSLNTFPWNNGSESRFLSMQPPGNFYSPNPGGEDLINNEIPTTRTRSLGWSWHRLWQRNLPGADAHIRFQQSLSRPDPQYGFNNTNLRSLRVMDVVDNANDTIMHADRNPPVNIDVRDANTIDTLGANGHTIHSNCRPFQMACENSPYGVWGAPPPYSDPNSITSRSYYHYIKPLNISAHCTESNSSNCGSANSEHDNKMNPNNQLVNVRSETSCNIKNYNNCHQSGIQGPTLAMSTNCPSSPSSSSAAVKGIISATLGFRYNNSKPDKNYKLKSGYANIPLNRENGCREERFDRFSDSITCAYEESNSFSNTLPKRKMKKRSSETGHKSIGSNSHYSARISVRQVFSNIKKRSQLNDQVCDERISSISGEINEYNEKQMKHNDNIYMGNMASILNVDDENINKRSNELTDPNESEVYFADVSSCCNISVKNDHFYEEAHTTHKCLIGELKDQAKNMCNGNTENCIPQHFGIQVDAICHHQPFPVESINVTHEKNMQIQQQHQLSRGIPFQNISPSMESDVKKNFADLSMLTPIVPLSQQAQVSPYKDKDGNESDAMKLSNAEVIASTESPKDFQSYNKSQPEAHYEIIVENQLPNNSSEFNNDNMNSSESLPSSPLRVNNNTNVRADNYPFLTETNSPRHTTPQTLVMKKLKKI